jgi:hypothetical protein
MTLQQSGRGIDMHTPWGKSDYSERFAPGIVFYGTSSHGGIHLSPARVAGMIPELLAANVASGYGEQWYEEDCAVALVALSFPEVPRFAQWVTEARGDHYRGPLACAERYWPDAVAACRDEIERRAAAVPVPLAV